MKKINEMSPAEWREYSDRMDEDLKAHPPTKNQTMYAKFCRRNIGYEWVDTLTGKRMGKGEMWSRYYGDAEALAKVTEGMNSRYKRQLKPGWIRVFLESHDGLFAIREEDKEEVLRREKFLIKKKKS